MKKIEIFLIGEIHNNENIIKKEVELIKSYNPDLLFLELLPNTKESISSLKKLLQGKLSAKDFIKIIGFDKKGNPNNMIILFDWLFNSNRKVLPLDNMNEDYRNIVKFELQIIREYRRKNLEKVKKMIIERDFKIFQEREYYWMKNIIKGVKQHNPQKIMLIIGVNHLKRFSANLKTYFMFDIKKKAFRSKKTIKEMKSWVMGELEGKDILKIKDPGLLLVDAALYMEVFIPMGFGIFRK